MRRLRHISRSREIYFHEDDYCQQELLPTEGAHFGADLRTLRITRDQLNATLCPLLPLFDAVYTGYGPHRERCRKTAAWGTSAQCALLADWDDDEIIRHAWAKFFDHGDEAILTATKAVAALGELYPLLYVDWAWGYKCTASDSDTFASMLRRKLEEIAQHGKRPKKG
jgi:hypothetical protein